MQASQAAGFWMTSDLRDPPCWDQTTAGDEKVLRLKLFPCLATAVVALKCVSCVETGYPQLVWRRSKHLLTVTSAIVKPWHLLFLILVLVIWSRWWNQLQTAEGTMTSQFRKLMSTCTRAPCMFYCVSCAAVPQLLQQKEAGVAARVLARCRSEKTTFFSKQQTHWSRVEEFMGWSSVPLTR